MNLKKLDEVINGTKERFPLAEFLMRLLPHIDNKEWHDETARFINLLNEAMK